MKKRLFVLTLLFSLIFSVISASASDAQYPEELKGNKYDGQMMIYMYVGADDSARAATNVVRFTDMNSSAEYYALFNPMNMKEEYTCVWSHSFSIPKGEYLVSGGRYMDSKAAFYLETEPSIITVGDGKLEFAVTVAPKEWFDSNEPISLADAKQIMKEQVAARMGVSVEEAFPTPTPYPEDEEFDVYEGEKEENVLPTVTPVPDKATPTRAAAIPQVEEEPEKKSKVPFVAIAAVVLFAIVFIIPKKKKNTPTNNTAEKQ